MQVYINSPEETKLVYTGYSGRVMSVETHIGTAVQGGSTNSVITGKDVYVTSSTFEIKKAKVILTNGRIKEFGTEKIEMQEGDEVEFITAENGKNIYVKNSTTGITIIADLYYTKLDLGLVAMACLAAIIFGVYGIFKGLFTPSLAIFIVGITSAVAGSIVLMLMIKIRNRLKETFESDFHKKVRATGIVVSEFKSVQESF
jgi:hypothetical protein